MRENVKGQVDVDNVGKILDLKPRADEYGGKKDRQRRVFHTGNANAAVKRLVTADYDFFHGVFGDPPLRYLMKSSLPVVYHEDVNKV